MLILVKGYIEIESRMEIIEKYKEIGSINHQINNKIKDIL